MNKFKEKKGMLYLFIVELVLFVLMINCVVIMAQNLDTPKKALEEQKIFRIYVTYLVVAVIYMLLLLGSCVGTALNILDIHSEKRALPSSKIRTFLLDTILFALGVLIVPIVICVIISIKFKDSTLVFPRTDLITLIVAGGVLAYHVICVAIDSIMLDEFDEHINKSYIKPKSNQDYSVKKQEIGKKTEASGFAKIMSDMNRSNFNSNSSNSSSINASINDKKIVICEKCGKKLDAGKEYVISLIEDGEEITQNVCEECLYEYKKRKINYSVVQSPVKK